MEELLGDANLPHERTEDARLELWRAHWKSVHPVLAGALRLTLPSPLEKDDPMMLERLTANNPSRFVKRLLGLLISRCDERPGRYSVSNTDELVAADTEVVARINEAASRFGGSVVGVVPVAKQSPASGQMPPREFGPKEVGTDVTATILTEFDGGLEGVSQIVAALNERPYDARGPRWDYQHLANALGYRLVEMLDAGMDAEVENAVRLVAAALMYTSGGAEFLDAIAQGLDVRNCRRMAAVAHTLAWTTQRGGGGWQTFGGETGVESLKRAAQLDAEVARSVIGTELQRVVTRGGGGLYGVTEGLLYALDSTGVAGIGVEEEGLRRARLLASWDAAAAVIAGRLPRVGESDDPEHPYAFREFVLDEGALNCALTLGVLASVGHPSREQKRRALVAVTVLLHENPSALSVALDAALRHLREPITLSALLQVLLSAPIGGLSAVISECAPALREVACSPHLVVRALARRLLSRYSLDQPQLPLMTDAIVGVDSDVGPIVKLVAAMAGCRIETSAHELTELRKCVERDVARLIDTDAFRERMKAQGEALTSRADVVWPNAVLADAECVEDVLQRVAGAGRALRAANGRLIADPASWEQQLATLLLNNPQLALSLEMVREPRPDLTEPPREGDPLWREIVSTHDVRRSAGSLRAARASKSQLSATTKLAHAEAVPFVQSGKSSGWRIVASIETRVERDGFGSKKSVRIARTVSALELRRSGIEWGLDAPPLGRGDMRVWFDTAGARGAQIPAFGPLIGEDSDCDGWGDNESGLGLHDPAIAPSGVLIGTLNLRPTEEALELGDDVGPALRLRTWRTCYIEGRHELTV